MQTQRRQKTTKRLFTKRNLKQRAESILRVLARLRNSLHRSWLVLTHDVVMAFASAAAAWALTHGHTPESMNAALILRQAATFALVALAISLWLPMYRLSWRHMHLRTLAPIAATSACAVLVWSPLAYLASPEGQFSLNLPMAVFVLHLGLLTLPRYLFRALIERGKTITTQGFRPNPTARLILLGYSEDAELFARALDQVDPVPFEILGVLHAEDHDYLASARAEHLGSYQDLEEVLDHFNQEGLHPHHLVVADKSLTPAQLRQLTLQAAAYGVSMVALPSLEDLTDLHPADLRLKSLTLNELLSPPQITLPRESLRQILHGRRIMIVGMGSELSLALSEKIATYSPDHITLVDCHESALFLVQERLQARHPHLSLSAILAETSHAESVKSLYAREHPHLVLHLLAPFDPVLADKAPHAVATSRLARTRVLAEAAFDADVQTFMLISSDGHDSSSLMGALTHMAEDYCHTLDHLRKKTPAPQFITLRIPSISGDATSLVSALAKAVRRGKTLHVPDEDVAIETMAERHGAAIILSALASAQQKQDSYGVLRRCRSSETLKLGDLTRLLASLEGRHPTRDVRLVVSEGDDDSLLLQRLIRDQLDKNLGTPALFQGLELYTPKKRAAKELRTELDKLSASLVTADSKTLKALIAQWVPHYKPN
ncbi:MAG: polysaccharide biosynthesis protein [Holosporales bacterium]